MFISKWILIPALLIFLGLATWTGLLVAGRNPLPFPDNGSRIFAARSPEAKAALVELLAQHGVNERFKADSGGVLRSIMWDGTIINYSTPDIIAKLGDASGCIGLVSDDPKADAEKAAAFLKAKGFSAEVVYEIEPGLPIVFVLTDALSGSVLNFRPHIMNMPTPE
ncbi:MAG: hypothetical protein KF685_12095 [Acidobacteria bacterium]|nr:hypothetical protein [Acidobacteriota bacterium]